MDRIGRFYSLSCPLTVAGYPWSQLHSGSVIMTIASMPFWIQVQVQVLAGPGCFVQRSTGLDRTGHTPKPSERDGWMACEREGCRSHSGASGSKTENVKFCNLLPESCFCQWLFGCFASAAAHTEGIQQPGCRAGRE